MSTLRRPYHSPTGSFFLLGPRGVGKSTYVKDQVLPELTLNLLESELYLDLKRNPSLLKTKTSNLHKGARILIDEIQKLPEILDEVHDLIEKRGLAFVLTGSSARKLKRGGANLLGGRALTRHMFPFSMAELGGNVSISRVLEIGSLPLVLADEATAEDRLVSYVETYLREEIREEALTRSLEDFVLFLEVSAQLNGRLLNFENIAGETGKSGDTVKKWYSILEETLIGTFLPSFRPGFKVREAAHSKFYYFDPGVARAAAGLMREPLDALTRGFSLETLTLNELRIYNEVSRNERKIAFYSVPGSEEIDFVIETRKKTIDRPGRFVTIEVKAAKKWQSSFEFPSRSLKARAGSRHVAMYGVYLGTEEIKNEGFHIMPFQRFSEYLQSGKLF